MTVRGDIIYQVITISLVVMGITHTISRERIFAGLRQRLGAPESWCGYLVSCPYCVSYWVAFAVVPLTQTYVVDVPYAWGALTSILRWFLSSVLITVVAAFFRIGFYFIDESQGLLRRRQKVVELDLNHEAPRQEAAREEHTQPLDLRSTGTHPR